MHAVSGHFQPMSMLQSTKAGETMRLLGSGLMRTPSEQKNWTLISGAQNRFNFLVKLKLYDFTICISCQDQILR